MNFVASLAAQVGYVFQNPDDQIFRYNVLDEVMFGRASAGEVIMEVATAAGTLITPLQRAGQTMKIANAKAAKPKASQLPGSISRPSVAPKPIRPGLAAKPVARPGRAAPAAPSSRPPSRPAAAAPAAPVNGTALKVPFERRDEAKSLGARWDSNARTWYAPPSANLEPFRQKGFV